MTGLVLIIEDDPDISEILRFALERENFQTRVAFTGEEGLHASLDRTNPPSIILLDLLVPGMTGNEICRRLRNEPQTQHTPILIITARALGPELTKSLRLSANDIISKPFSVQEVVARVRDLTNEPETRVRTNKPTHFTKFSGSESASSKPLK